MGPQRQFLRQAYDRVRRRPNARALSKRPRPASALFTPLFARHNSRSEGRRSGDPRRSPIHSADAMSPVGRAGARNRTGARLRRSRTPLCATVHSSVRRLGAANVGSQRALMRWGKRAHDDRRRQAPSLTPRLMRLARNRSDMPDAAGCGCHGSGRNIRVSRRSALTLETRLCQGDGVTGRRKPTRYLTQSAAQPAGSRSTFTVNAGGIG
jgi:hypothetical protein